MNNRFYHILKLLDEKHNLVYVKKAYRSMRSLVGRLNAKRNKWAWILESQKLKRLKDIHTDRERCFIIGNGPSIRQQDLTKLKDEITFVTNWFILHKDYEKINPRYYCVSDQGFYDSSGINRDWYELMMAKTKNAVKFLPFDTKKVIKKQGLFNEHDIFYLYYLGEEIWKKQTINLNVTKPLDAGDTVIIDFCLPLAFYMGFKEVYLLGCDCDYGIDKDKSYKNAFFYDIDNHKTEYRRLDYHKGVWFDNVITSYAVAKKAFETSGRKIYNAGIGGKLEVFKRVNYNNLF